MTTVPSELDCTCRIIGLTRDPYEPHIPAEPEWEQADDCPVHPLIQAAYTDDWRTMPPVYARLIEGPSAVQVATAQVLTVLQDHRRVRNTRGCSACTWSPQPVGRNGDPEAMGRRAHQFNAHLAQLIAETLLGASTLLGSPHGPGHTPTAADPPPGERQAPH